MSTTIKIDPSNFSGPDAESHAKEVGQVNSTQRREARAEALLPGQQRLANARAQQIEAKNAAAAKVEADAARATLNAQSVLRGRVQDTLAALAKVRKLAYQGAGYAALARKIPGTQAKELQSALEYATKSGVFSQSLADLKSGSKTGSTSIGRILQSEIPMLVGRFGALDAERNPTGIIQTVDDIENAVRTAYARENGASDALASQDPQTRLRAMTAYGITEPGQPRSPAVSAPLYSKPTETPGLLAAGSETKSLPIPPAMQQAFEGYVAKNYGDLDPKAYADFRAQLDKQYNFGPLDPAKRAEYEKEAATLNDMAKRGVSANLQIPPVNAAATAFEKETADAAADPIGSRLKAALAGAAQSGVGLIFNEDTRAKLAALQQKHPEWATGGKLADAVLLTSLGARAGMNPFTANVVQGAYSGANEHPEAPVSGAAVGAATNAAFGKAGEAVAPFIKGVGNVPLPLMTKYGVPTTAGDILGGLTSKYIEPTIAKIPFAGAPLRARQNEALKGFNSAALNHALEDIGATTGRAIGHEGAATALDAVNGAYTAALHDVQVPQIRDKIDGFLVQLDKTAPAAGKTLRNAIQPILEKTELNGEDVQQLLQEVRNTASGFRGEPGWKQNIKPATDGMQKTVEEHLAENGFKDNLALLRKANAANRKVSVVVDSVNAHQGEGGVFTPKTLLKNAESSAKDFEGKGALARNQTAAGEPIPMLDIAKEGMRLGMPGKTGMTAPATVAGLGLADLGVRYLARDENDHSGDYAANALRDTALLTALAGGPAAAYTKTAQNAARKRLLQTGGGNWLTDALLRYAPAAGATVARNFVNPTPRYAPPAVSGGFAQLPLPSGIMPPVVDLPPEDQSAEQGTDQSLNQSTGLAYPVGNE
jgi:hypothetical protein